MDIKKKKELEAKYNEIYPIAQGKQKMPYLLLLDGTIGSGKSTVIQFIKQYLNVEVLSNDQIRNFLHSEVPTISFEEREELVKMIQYPRIKQALDLNNIVVFDSNISGNFDKKIQKIKQMGYSYFIIRVKCDEKMNAMRVINRDNRVKTDQSSNEINYSLADYNEFLYDLSEKNILNDDLIFYEIDTTGSLESIDKQVEAMIYKLLSLQNDVISIDESKIRDDGQLFFKRTNQQEYENLLLINNKLSGKKMTIDNKEYTFHIPQVFSFQDNVITMEKCDGDNLELLLRKENTHNQAVLMLNEILKYLIYNNIYWFDFAPRNIIINDSTIHLVDFERPLIFDKLDMNLYFKDTVYEEYSAFLKPNEKIINEKQIYENASKLILPTQCSKRVLTILELLGEKEELKADQYYYIVRKILTREKAYNDKTGNIVFPLVVLENVLIQKGYEAYAKKIMEVIKMRKEYKPFSNVKGFYLNDGFLQSDSGLNLRLRKDGFIPKSGLIYNTVLGDCENKKVLDLGCGDLGILGVLARQNGAATVDSVDIDMNCVQWFNRLIQENNFTNMKCYYSDNFSMVHDRFDTILTNLAQMPMISGSAHDSGGFDGRDNIIQILQQAPQYLNNMGDLYMLLFDFLGVEHRTNAKPSIEEIAQHYGYHDMEILECVNKEIKKGSVTYDNIEHIADVYPKYNFNTNEKGNPYCKIMISRFKK